MKTATQIGGQRTSRAGANQILYRLSEPMKYHEGDNELSTDYVIVSSVVAMFSGPETYIFPANADGDVIDWGELEGSYRGGMDHAEALKGAGYEVDAFYADACREVDAIAPNAPSISCEEAPVGKKPC